MWKNINEKKPCFCSCGFYLKSDLLLASSSSWYDLKSEETHYCFSTQFLIEFWSRFRFKKASLIKSYAIQKIKKLNTFYLFVFASYSTVVMSSTEVEAFATKGFWIFSNQPRTVLDICACYRRNSESICLKELIQQRRYLTKNAYWRGWKSQTTVVGQKVFFEKIEDFIFYKKIAAATVTNRYVKDHKNLTEAKQNTLFVTVLKVSFKKENSKKHLKSKPI